MIPASYLFKSTLDDRWGNPTNRFAAPETGRKRNRWLRPATRRQAGSADNA